MKCYNCNATQATPIPVCPDSAACGCSFQATKLTWKKAEPFAFYADKIFSAHRAEGSSIFYPLNTAVLGDNFVSAYELTPCTGGCCCSASTLSPDAVFEIQKSYVQLDCFSVNDPVPPGEASGVISPENVTVNGLPVDGVTVTAGRYIADVTTALSSLTNPTCVAQGLPSKAYILLQGIDNLQMRLRFGFEGVVRSCGTLYRFKVYLANNETLLLPAEQTTSFAVAEANSPCAEYGYAPVISFRFGGRAAVINPQLSVTVVDEADPCNGIRLDLTATLGITPLVYAEVVRSTLMLVDGAELGDDCTCGMDGFSLYANNDCCTPAKGTAQTSNTSGILPPMP